MIEETKKPMLLIVFLLMVLCIIVPPIKVGVTAYYYFGAFGAFFFMPIYVGLLLGNIYDKNKTSLFITMMFVAEIVIFLISIIFAGPFVEFVENYMNMSIAYNFKIIILFSEALSVSLLISLLIFAISNMRLDTLIKIFILMMFLISSYYIIANIVWDIYHSTNPLLDIIIVAILSSFAIPYLYVLLFYYLLSNPKEN